jgi:hypothetical protein
MSVCGSRMCKMIGLGLFSIGWALRIDDGTNNDRCVSADSQAAFLLTTKQAYFGVGFCFQACRSMARFKGRMSSIGRRVWMMVKVQFSE